MVYCQAKKLREKTIAAHEQTLKLFVRWLEEEKNISKAEKIGEKTIQDYILDLQQRGKYTCLALFLMIDTLCICTSVFSFLTEKAHIDNSAIS